ncbi:predicted protein [Thalassiosira pseudonana CCMP1335]|uniref:SLC26A/SulP transporter domain-containing protein n=1 Tax=Thalassiosira pseudonana TaxID=35128 RepID=B8LEK9_THAPS|nr:predicted protein [Thalassiosira pseudonana CCMP1335]EED86234.1 predicted protein [Thalassiosira pseudonana CCMP1335]
MWFLANSDQFISSIIVAINLIPEAISYALMAGLPPTAALQSCWIVNIITSLVGGRPGMISSASGLIALLLHHGSVVTGVMFVPYAIMFAGALQMISAFFGLGRLASRFPAPVVVGMVNAMALLLLALQGRYAKDFPLMALSLLISMFLPRFTTFFPATLVSVLVIVGVEFGIARQFGVETPLIGDYGGSQVHNPIETIFSDKYTLPSLSTLENWKIISGYGSALFATSFTETAISLNVVDRLDETQGPGFMVLIGQGLANIVSGLLGGMGGSGVVSSSVLADRTFGTTCLSTFSTGLVMFLFVTWGYPVIDFIPLSAISGIAISMVCSFIQWRSMVAIFTTCLPTRKRDMLPPQYNVARYDVFIMIFVTAACLLADVATLAFFVMGLAVFVFAAFRSCCCKTEGADESGDSISNLDDDVPKKKFFEWRGKKSKKHLQDTSMEEGEGVEVSTPGVMDAELVRQQQAGDEEADATSCCIMEAAENAIFPTHSDEPRQQQQQ